jgi:uncharacterized protein YbbK (DUF523 family)/uncharacterized protein YbgA (DUF1722 family)
VRSPGPSDSILNRSVGDGAVRVGVSACLLGHEVRYDGGHKRDAFVAEMLARFVELVPVCPEVELGLGVPRETLRLEYRGNDIRIIGNSTATDHTIAMREYAERRLAALAELNLCGYILKQNSPSCGLKVPILGGGGPFQGRGLFAAALLRRWPLLPVEEETRLQDIPSRKNFLERVFARHRLRTFFSQSWTRAGLIAFHQRHELQMLCHSPRAHRKLSRLVHASNPGTNLRPEYETGFMRALLEPATRPRQVPVLREIADSLGSYLEPQRRSGLDDAICDYQNGRIQVLVLIRLMHQYAHQFDIDYLKCQTYFEPYPLELMVQLNQ